MTNDPYILFNQSIQQCRQLGARGGRAHALNSRLRRWASASAPTPTIPVIQPPLETAAEANAAIDAQFPWLRGAEKRTPRLSSAATPR